MASCELLGDKRAALAFVRGPEAGVGQAPKVGVVALVPESADLTGSKESLASRCNSELWGFCFWNRGRGGKTCQGEDGGDAHLE